MGDSGKKRKRQHSPTAWILIICLIISLTALVLYLLDLNYNDTVLFFLLTVLRYSSFWVFIFSFYKLIINIYRMFHGRPVLHIMNILIYLIFIIYGLSIFFIEVIINVIAGGNG